ncbi:hypothetical protein APHCRT_1006 [Anaplasma phagocytophilum str. CRT53-1]|uniref:Uncharacterized protein n=5 Tax=Anaplasma phagocytophilum TaxID=948 RepID=Q2GJJ2_ANAPZ|nr:hypothetical protein APH_0883 [Anaplasma phagocytophilum str. HZ]EOA61142.1 hypothetical protein HGE1_03782 [Anaplasma phagocytophilum str. HGE1]EOA62332.1 hypothetical protein CRT38_03667 [Anaplasma phagocytophilum str. CRT38]KJV63225.1 hypothetical protein EPHNCH_1210 [Anaplasma phagocytophilum str. NCH-1]KJV83356.1 hypothetical protein APHHGE2_1188 [Anaplasma phagocytophilum str. HGE2]KJV85212.1 hypothetical protein APHWI1_0391 [Anaplasma phagocytophilum str. ApWI1]KJV85641.1 hypothetic
MSNRSLCEVISGVINGCPDIERILTRIKFSKIEGYTYRL